MQFRGGAGKGYKDEFLGSQSRGRKDGGPGQLVQLPDAARASADTYTRIPLYPYTPTPLYRRHRQA
eukprot:9523424-Heterocapsa_arctica.AAC.1